MLIPSALVVRELKRPRTNMLSAIKAWFASVFRLNQIPDSKS
jgi:hypothetical protein